jgi:hypothetical protein
MVQIAALAMANRDERRLGLGVFARVTVTPGSAAGSTTENAERLTRKRDDFRKE